MSPNEIDLESLDLDKKKLAHDILVVYHTQFAENQRTREQSFLKILGFLGAVIFGYAYVYNKLWFSIDEFSLVAIAGELILLFGALVITTIAYNFRRDQFINAKIRKSCGLLGDNNIFSKDFDPSRSLRNPWRIINWMPNFLGVFYLVFSIFQVVLFISYAIKLKIDFTTSNINWYITFTFITFLVTISTTVGFTIYSFMQLRSKLGIKEKTKKRKPK